MNRFRVRITHDDFVRLTKALIHEQLSEFEPDTLPRADVRSHRLANEILVDEGVVLTCGSWSFETECRTSVDKNPHLREMPSYWIVVIA